MCPDCGAEKSLRSHGGFYRRVVAAIDDEQVVWVKRVRCGRCRRAFSCLYDWLVPYRHYSLEVLGAVLEEYLLKPASYARTVWGLTTRMSPSTLFHVLEAMLKRVKLAMQQLQLFLVDAGIFLPADDSPCPNSFKTKSQSKAKALDTTARLVRLAQSHFRAGAIVGLQQFFSTRSLPVFSFLTGRLSVPHNWQCLIF